MDVRRCEIMQGDMSSQPRVDRARILLVDDDPSLIVVLGRVLRDQGDVETATTATEAIVRIRDGARYALILSDLRLPEASGLDLLDVLRAEAPAQARRFVMMTGDERSADEMRSSGIPVLQKPFSRPALLSVAASYVTSTGTGGRPA
jgi:CheY-like chemotaxis protein